MILACINDNILCIDAILNHRNEEGKKDTDVAIIDNVTPLHPIIYLISPILAWQNSKDVYQIKGRPENYKRLHDRNGLRRYPTKEMYFIFRNLNNIFIS